MGGDTTQERRLSAVMFTDMVGYSALTQKNETLAVELLEEHRVILRSLFDRHKGKEIETVGDAFFVEFASALKAVQCAVAIQKKLFERYQHFHRDRSIKVRIGVHAGDVIHKDKQVLGDCVNIAARMEPLAEPGGICLSEDVARQVYNKIDLPIEDLGKGSLKNIRLPMKFFKVVLPWNDTSSSYLSSKSFFNNRKKHLLVVAAAIIICFFGYYLIQSFQDKWPTNRLAFLPFDNYSPNGNDEYIADGFTEEIIAVLSKIEDLQVIARTSVMKYKNIVTDISKVAFDLNVGLVIEGSVRKDKNRIRLTAQLIRTKTQDHLWAETYDMNYDHIFNLQQDIAFKVARVLELKIKDLEKIQIMKRSTEYIEAYDLYLKGRYLWNTRLPKNLLAGRDYFRQAISIDPNFALSHAGIADSYHLLTSYGLLAPKIGFTQAKKSANQAMALDEDLAEAFNSLAAINLLYDWNWKKAETRFIKALKLNPNYIQTYSWYALYLSVHKRFDEAKSILYKAIELDPLSAITRTDLGQVYYHAGNYVQAIEEYQRSLELDSVYAYTFAYQGQTYAMLNMLDKAEYAFQYGVKLTDNKDPATLAGLAYVYARQKKIEKAKIILSQLENLRDIYYVHPVYLSIIFQALGDKREALNWLERGYEERSEWMIYLQVEHMLDPLRRDARFVDLVKKMNFE